MTALWKVRQTPEAQKDRAKIIRWTIRHFGIGQAETYTETIALAMAALRDGPGAAGVRKRNDIVPGILALHVARNGRKGRHFGVFRIGGDNIIDVLRLLHDSMDLAERLSA
jgi:toxin ParE1/3/4